MRRAVFVASWFFALAAGAGCERVPVGDGAAERDLERERVSVAREQLSTATSAAFNEALDGIAAARCEHERRCDNVGGGKRYATAQACRASVRTGFSDDLVPAECPDGVDRRGLEACLKAVRDEGCGPDLDTLARVGSCRTAALCPRRSASR